MLVFTVYFFVFTYILLCDRYF